MNKRSGSGLKNNKNSDVLHFLPSLTQKASKQKWMHQSGSYIHKAFQTLATDDDGIQLVEELIRREKFNKSGKIHHNRYKKTGTTKSAKSALGKMSQPKRAKESFRKSLIDVLINRFGDKSAENKFSDALTTTDKDILRYYYYIHNGIDTDHVAPMEDSWLQNVFSLVPQKLKSDKEATIEKLSESMKEDYLLS
ncbi:hypothetical protein A3Q56_08480, partial [Intoshia linei]